MKNSDFSRYMVIAVFTMLTGCNGGVSQVAPIVSMQKNAAWSRVPLTLRPKVEPLFNSLYSFKGGTDGGYPAAGLTGLNGVFYGTTENVGNYYGTVFSITTSGHEQVLYSFKGRPNDGSDPGPSRLIALNDVLYGTTYEGGTGFNHDVWSGTRYSLFRRALR